MEDLICLLATVRTLNKTDKICFLITFEYHLGIFHVHKLVTSQQNSEIERIFRLIQEGPK